MADCSRFPSLGKCQCFSGLLLCVLVLLTPGTFGLDTCIEVKTAFTGKGFDESDVPVKAVSGSDLTICPHSETCCTQAMEEKLTSHSRKEHTAQLNKTFDLIQRTFLQRSRKFDEFFKELINTAEQGLDEMFLETYGVLYRQNDKIFEDLFKELRSYYSGKDMDLMLVMRRFFHRLLVKMFQLINSLQMTEGPYMDCLARSMDELKPFGDVPTKLSMHVKRAFIAARTFVQGLAVGRDVLANIKEMGPSDSCVKAIVRMTYCPHCRGLTSTKPCSFYCLNTMKGCLANHAELNADWNKYIEALTKLGERLDGPFNIESVVAPIDVDISNAIMNMQETAVVFTEEVIKQCGDISQLRKMHSPPMARAKREAQGPQAATSQGPAGGYTSRRQQHTFDMRRRQQGTDRRKSSKSRDCSKSGNCLDKLVRDLKDKLKPAKNFWTNLPYMACQEEALAADATVQDDCWNGTDRARYVAEVQEDGVLRQISNPEVEVDVQVVNSVFNRQRMQLQHITHKLTQAHKGEHVSWVDTDMDATYVGGSGSGDDMLYDDDEDDDDEDYYSPEDDIDDTEDGDDYHGTIDGYSDDEDDYLDASGDGYQGSGSGSHGYVTDDEKKGFVDIDLSPDRFTPTGSGSHSGRGRGHNRDRYHHKQGGNKHYPTWVGGAGEGQDRNAGGPGTFNNNRGTSGGSVPTIVNPGGGMYNPNNNRQGNQNRGETPTAQEKGEASGKDAASSSSAASVGVVLLLLGSHWLLVRRFSSQSPRATSC